MKIGDRIRCLRPASVTEHYKRHATSRQYWPAYGEMGTIIKLPRVYDERGNMLFGGGPLVRWDGGGVAGLGSGDRFENVD